MHIYGEDRWPFFDDVHQYFSKEELKFSSATADSQQFFEFAVPKKEKNRS
jgi:hypothetical protein